LTIRGKEAASRIHTNLSFIQYPAAARRFFPSNFPKSPVIPNSDKPELAEVWRDEGSPTHSRILIEKMCIKNSRGQGDEALVKVINNNIKKVGQSGVKWIIFIYFSLLFKKRGWPHS